MTVTAGCDVGSLTAKVVLMRQNRILGSSVVRSRVNPRESADEALRAALADSGLSRNDIACCVGTGYGRTGLPLWMKRFPRSPAMAGGRAGCCPRPAPSSISAARTARPCISMPRAR